MNVSLMGHFWLGEGRRNLDLDRCIIEFSLSCKDSVFGDFFKCGSHTLIWDDFIVEALMELLFVKQLFELCSEKFSS